MKIEKLQATATATTSPTTPVTALGATDLRNAAAGVAPFSCAYVIDFNDIGYHDGYPRD